MKFLWFILKRSYKGLIKLSILLLAFNSLFAMIKVIASSNQENTE